MSLFKSLRTSLPSVQSRSLIQNGVTARSLATSSVMRKDSDGASRTSPGQTLVQGGERPHPGYTSYETPATSAHPKDIPDAPSGAKPSGKTATASTKQAPPHPDVREMASGAEQTGSDAITPAEKTTKVWGPNARTPEFNQREGRRRPVLDGESHEGTGPPKN
ncbi:unnamed protein product [Sympodiomycopsis kandeliae]